MTKKQGAGINFRAFNSDVAVGVAAMLLGAVCFIAVYGVCVLDPTYDDWLLGRGDLTQHYLGWRFFCESEWTFPIGLTNRLAYPDDSSVIFTDSIPLFAVFFKLLSPILPDTFQYLGWWGLVCFMLQGLFAAKILTALDVKGSRALAGSILFILSPVVIEKMFRHTALGGHWIILAAIYLFVRHRELYGNVRKTSLYFGLIGAYVGSVHLYLLPMCGAFVCGFVLSSLLCSLFCSMLCARRGEKPGRAPVFGIRGKLCMLKYVLPGISYAVCLLACTWLLGGFSTRAEAGSSDLGQFSFNLNGFFNAKGYSRFLSPLNTYYDGQYEGFAYLGLGVLCLFVPSLVYMIRSLYGKHAGKCKKSDGTGVIYGVVYALMCAGLIVLAASPEVTFGDRLLFVLTDSSTLTHYWSIFRSTGRMVWPVCYLIYIGVIVCSDRLFRGRRAATALLVLCAAVQIFDISGKLKSQRNTFAEKKTYESPLQSEVWQQAAENDALEHVVWVSHNIDNNGILHIAKFALDNGLTMNNYYFARGINVNENTKKSLEHPSEDCLYIFRSDETEGIDGYGLNLYEADGYILGTVEALGN